MTWLQMLASVLVVSAASLVAATLLVRFGRLRHATVHLVALAVGALYGDVFFHLLPEALGRRGASDVFTVTLGGLLSFFVVEKLVRRPGPRDSERRARALASMNLIGDTLHNAIDGLVIGGSYAVNVQLGVTTTIAVLLHELPQELGDVGVRVHGGLSPRRALRWNALVSLAAVAGGVVGLVLGEVTDAFADVLVPFTAGAFLYLAGSDLVPELHRDDRGAGAAVVVAQLAAIAAGVTVMMLAA